MKKDFVRQFNMVIYFLHGMPNVRDEAKYDHLEGYLSKNCDVDELTGYLEPIRFFTSDDTINLKEIGIGGSLRQSNEDAHYFLKRFLAIVEKLLAKADCERK